MVLSACGNETDKVDIGSEKVSETLYIQKVEDNRTTEEQTAVRQEKEINKELLEKLDGMEIKKSDESEIKNKMNTQDTYTYSFSDEGDLSSGSESDFSFAVIEDGTFLMPENAEQSGTVSYQSVEKHPELLNEMNHLVDISF
ncbi:hypothetical protein [Halobacillus andaensis]|nr:hypothetical protein [Halobacillus andaensis]MBP2005894.1 hypothetical protein [Halobacillus andaensis]